MGLNATVARDLKDVSGPQAYSTADVVAASTTLRERMAAALAAEGLRCCQAAELGLARPAGSVLVMAWSGRESGPAGARRLREQLGEDTPIVLVVEGWPDVRAMRRAMRMHVEGIVIEAEIEAALGPTVRAVLARQVVIPMPARRHLDAEPLSFREKQVLAMVVAGFANGQIAERLYLAESTVKSHLTSAFVKLGVKSRSEAAALILDPYEPVGQAVMAAGDEAVLGTLGGPRP